MTTGRFLLLVVLIIAAMALPQIASADNVVVDIGGTVPTPDNSDSNCQLPNCFNLTGSFGPTCPGTSVKSITISKNIDTQGSPRVEVITDPGTNGIDYLAARNLKIKANCPVTDLRIAFGFNHVSQPATPPNLRYTYKASGIFSASTGRSIKVKASWRNSPPSPPSTVFNSSGAIGSEKQYTTNLVTFNLSDVTQNISSITNPRGLEGEFKFTLPAQNDLLKITTYYVQNTTSTGDGGNGTGGLLSTLCPTTQATAKAFGCDSCVSEDGIIAEGEKAQVFAHATWNNLIQNLASGQGEYLTSLAALLKVPTDQQSIFFSLAEDHYLALIKSDSATPNVYLTTLKERMSGNVSIANGEVIRR